MPGCRSLLRRQSLLHIRRTDFDSKGSRLRPSNSADIPQECSDPTLFRHWKTVWNVIRKQRVARSLCLALSARSGRHSRPAITSSRRAYPPCQTCRFRSRPAPRPWCGRRRRRAPSRHRPFVRHTCKWCRPPSKA